MMIVLEITVFLREYIKCLEIANDYNKYYLLQNCRSLLGIVLGIDSFMNVPIQFLYYFNHKIFIEFGLGGFAPCA